MKKIYFVIVFLVFTSVFGQSKIHRILEHHFDNDVKLIVARGSDPVYHFKNKISFSLTPKDLIKPYRENTALVFYSFINERLHILAIRHENIYEGENFKIIEKNISGKELSEKINFVNRSFNNGISENIIERGSGATDLTGNTEQQNKIFREVNTLLFLEELNLQGIEHLIILPSANIGMLPFSVFNIHGKMLIEQMDYNIAPNLYSVANLTLNDYTFNNVLFVSNPKYRKDGYHFQDLPGAEKEVQRVSSQLKNNQFHLLKGKEATKANLLQKIDDYDILYFATHGFSDAENAIEKSFIALSGETKEEAYLTTKEFQHRKMKAKMVVLSACETGLGQTHEGGVIGLARGFQKAGANDVLMSLWNISDNETTKIMDRFFFFFRNGKGKLTPSEALRQTILEYRKQNPDSSPRYWAAFSVFGVPYLHQLDDNKLIPETSALKKGEKQNELIIKNESETSQFFFVLSKNAKGQINLLFPKDDSNKSESIRANSETKINFTSLDDKEVSAILVMSEEMIESCGDAQYLLLDYLKNPEKIQKEVTISKLNLE